MQDTICFHGTTQSKAESIITNGFAIDKRANGLNSLNYVYLTPNKEYAYGWANRAYVKQSNKTDYPVILVCKVNKKDILEYDYNQEIIVNPQSINIIRMENIQANNKYNARDDGGVAKPLNKAIAKNTKEETLNKVSTNNKPSFSFSSNFSQCRELNLSGLFGSSLLFNKSAFLYKSFPKSLSNKQKMKCNSIKTNKSVLNKGSIELDSISVNELLFLYKSIENVPLYYIIKLCEVYGCFIKSCKVQNKLSYRLIKENEQ